MDSSIDSRGVDARRLRVAAWTRVLILLFVGPAAFSAGTRQPAQDDPALDVPALESATAITLGDSLTVSQLDYVMEGKIRLLFFWKGADDVGGGYIRRSVSQHDPEIRLIQVLFGSDPADASTNGEPLPRVSRKDPAPSSDS